MNMFTYRNTARLAKELSKHKTKNEEVQKEKSFLEEQLSAEKIKYENDVMQLQAKLSFQHEQQQLAELRLGANTSRRTSVGSSATEENDTSHMVSWVFSL